MASGHVEKKGKNWYVVLELENEDGERRRRWVSAKKELGLAKRPTKPQAEELLDKYLRDLHDGTYVEPTDITVKEYLLQWLEDYAKPNVKPTTYGIYKNMIKKHIIPALGDIELSRLRKSKIKGFLAEKQKDGARADKKPGRLSNRSVEYIYVVLKSVLKHAVEDELLKKSPAEGITPPRPGKSNIKYWERHQVEKFLRALRETNYKFKKMVFEGHRLYALYLLALTTGMRRGEILGLKWNSIDFKKKTIRIRSTLVDTDDGYLFQDSTKTGNERTISISNKLAATLDVHKARQSQEFMALGRPEKDMGLVFTTTTGTPISPRNLNRQFQCLLKKFDLPQINFHALRHTCATMLIEDGIDLKTIADLLGHINSSMLLNIYSHVTSKMKDRAVNAFDDLMD